MRTFLILQFFVFQVFSLGALNLDSLLQKLEQHGREDTAKVKLLIEVSRILSKRDPEKGIVYANQCIRLSDSIHYDFGKAMGFHMLGIAVKNTGDYFTPAKHFQEALNIFRRIGSVENELSTINQQAVLFKMQGNYATATQLFFELLRRNEKLGIHEGAAGALNNIGNVYNAQGNHDLAIQYYKKALDISEKHNVKNLVPVTLSNVGLVMVRNRQFDSALYYFRVCYSLDYGNTDLEGQANSLTNIAAVYDQMDVVDSAYYYYSLSEQLYRKIGHPVGAAKQVMRIGKIKAWEHKYGEALPLLLQAYETLEKAEDPVTMIAITYELSSVYEKLGMHKEALEYHKKLYDWNKKAFNDKNTRELTQAEMKYSFEKQEAEARLLQAKRDAVAAEKEHKQKITIMFTVGGLVIVIVFSIFLFGRLRVIRSQKKVIEDQRREVVHAYDSLQVKNKEVLDSIKYAKRIQQALISSEKYIERKLRELKKR